MSYHILSYPVLSYPSIYLNLIYHTYGIVSYRALTIYIYISLLIYFQSFSYALALFQDLISQKNLTSKWQRDPRTTPFTMGQLSKKNTKVVSIVSGGTHAVAANHQVAIEIAQVSKCLDQFELEVMFCHLSCGWEI